MAAVMEAFEALTTPPTLYYAAAAVCAGMLFLVRFLLGSPSASFSISTTFSGRRPREVFDILTDFDRAPQLMENCVRMRKVSDGPVGVGTRLEEIRSVSGVEETVELVVAAWEPPAMYAIYADTMGIRVQYTYSLEDNGSGGTVVSCLCEVSTTVYLKRSLIPLVLSAMRKEDGDHLDKIVARLADLERKTK
ncbi:uncharacterized protein AMSG_03740 [Thecamonas trahens ATCC 50062]|uniref:Uncharacterized protein n=1 Tax=Thecamonas trahens ATCC 50062 TaxID=461836 RepID=A0A0L0D4Y4_THETB|nr:hypothetical protein AMSG_03740 [Thecamonas trahens ATCC 50062]KNC47305.1 hypothetical protein AMSG_03740 [Thecamonas trahens ATCC 50062]|eukprot:XP_013759646.1 hypothetical protein AMSG_03740 [Thecamonas trahens ATCC 50062]